MPISVNTNYNTIKCTRVCSCMRRVSAPRAPARVRAMYDVTSEYVGFRYVTAPSRAITRALTSHSSSSHSTTMQTDSAIPYPPTAILSCGRAEIPSPHTTSQPNHVPQMQIAGGKHAPPEKQGNAERLRGGCVPCPDGSICWIIPIPCCCC